MMRWLARLARPAPRRFQAPGGPDEVLLQAVAVLRALDARILRYDAEAGALEARVAPWGIPGVVRLTAAADGPAARVTIACDAPGARAIVRVLGRELARGAPPGAVDEREDRT
jgi:hypothetical protein